MAGTLEEIRATGMPGSDVEIFFQAGGILSDIVDDLETLRVAVSAGGVTLVNELRDDHATLITWMTEVDADLDDINNYLSALREQNGAIGGDYTFAGQAAATTLGAGTVHYRIGGEEYYIALDTTITLTGTTVVTGSNWRAWRVVIDPLGVVTTESPDNAGQSTEQIALLELGSISQAANTAELGTFVIQAATGFTPATDNTSGENVFTARYTRTPKNEAAALTAAMGTALVATAGATTVAVGTADFKVSGVRVAQVAADATLAMTDADTIADGEAGGMMVLSDLAGTGFVTLSSDGVPGVTALTDTDAAGALTALNSLASRLPSCFVPLGHVIVVASGAAYTAKTTNWDAASMTTTVVDQTLGTHDRTVAAASFLARKSNPPAIPATVAAALVATISAAAASSTAVDAAGDMIASKVALNP